MPRSSTMTGVNVFKATQERLSVFCKMTGRSQVWVITTAIEEWLAKQPEADQLPNSTPTPKPEATHAA
ncbi:MAG TPA: hypothetical protein V6D29_24090 [Leptolyngbyaceae cyanobacterium]